MGRNQIAATSVWKKNVRNESPDNGWLHGLTYSQIEDIFERPKACRNNRGGQQGWVGLRESYGASISAVQDCAMTDAAATRQSAPMSGLDEPIRAGDVIEKIEVDEFGERLRGVVEHVYGPGEQVPAILPIHTGDIRVRTGAGRWTGSNKFSSWRHVPREDQTHRERIEGWLAIPAYDMDENELRREREIYGPMALFPTDILEEIDDWPMSLEESLVIVADHMDQLSAERAELQATLAKVTEMLAP